MRAFSPQRRHRSLPDVFVQLWRRWMATRADQLLETARLGSDKLDYLTHNPKASDADLCTIAGGRADDLLRRRMLALELDPYEMALSDPALLRHLQRCCGLCESREDCASDLVRASAGQAWQGRDDCATIVRTPWHSRCSLPCVAVQRQRRSTNVHISPDERRLAT